MGEEGIPKEKVSELDMFSSARKYRSTKSPYGTGYIFTFKDCV